LARRGSLHAGPRAASGADCHEERYDPVVSPDDFDDVGYEILEAPELGPRRRRGRRTAAIAVAVVGVSAIVAGGALAVTGTGSTQAPARARPVAAPPVTFTADGIPTVHGGVPSHMHPRERRSSPRY
jgi:hypothetical protein